MLAVLPGKLPGRAERRAFCLSSVAAGLAPLSARARPVPLEIGVLPNISARALMNQYQPMREFLARELDRPIHVSTAPDWKTFHSRVLALDYDLLITAAHMARLAQLDRGYVPQLSYVPRIKVLLITARAKPVAAVAELRGRTVALSNPQSLVTLRAIDWLAEHGLVPGRDYQTVRTAADDSVGDVVLRGDAAAAICSGGEFRVIPEPVRSGLQVQQTLAEVASFIAMTSARLSADNAREIRDALLGFSANAEEGRQFLAATGFSGIEALEPGVMEAMDAYVAPTRRLL